MIRELFGRKDVVTRIEKGRYAEMSEWFGLGEKIDERSVNGTTERGRPQKYSDHKSEKF